MKGKIQDTDGYRKTHPTGLKAPPIPFVDCSTTVGKTVEW